jgi:hypothetical protein
MKVRRMALGGVRLAVLENVNITGGASVRGEAME